jgi:hypothetical protein
MVRSMPFSCFQNGPSWWSRLSAVLGYYGSKYSNNVLYTGLHIKFAWVTSITYRLQLLSQRVRWVSITVQAQGHLPTPEYYFSFNFFSRDETDSTWYCGLLCQPPMIDDDDDDDDYDCGANGGMRTGRGNRSTRRKLASVPHCPPQIPHELTQAWTRTAAVGSRQLTAWAMARPLLWLCHNFAMNTVFQAFFITLLVQHGLGKQIFTLEELTNSHIIIRLNSTSTSHITGHLRHFCHLG